MCPYCYQDNQDCWSTSCGLIDPISREDAEADYGDMERSEAKDSEAA